MLKAIVDIIRKKIPELKQLILGKAFDTTSSNGGWKNRVTVKLEEYISKKLVHAYCRQNALAVMY